VLFQEATVKPSIATRLSTLPAMVLCLLAGQGWANPIGGSVVAGQAGIAQQGKVLTVTSTTPKTAIDWQSFSIGADEITRFVQPSSDSSVLNRVLTAQPSVLLGGLESNGRVFLINPAGILVGEGARIDVGGFVASSLHMDLDDFLADRFEFQGTPGAGRVENRGGIRSAEGGSIFLVAPEVENSGLVEAPGGEVILAAGDSGSRWSTPGHRACGSSSVPVTHRARSPTWARSWPTPGPWASPARWCATAAPSARTASSGRAGGSSSGQWQLRTDEGSVVSADGATRGGEIEISAGSLMSGGTLSADGGDSGGLVRIAADTAVHAGRISATGNTGAGGALDITVTDKALHNRHSSLDASGTEGGSIREVAGNGLTGSASYRAVGSQGQGGRVDLSANEVTLLSADVDVRGASGGGEVRIGGELPGRPRAVHG
jgi:filamentous hemagglutinin family protein